ARASRGPSPARSSTSRSEAIRRFAGPRVRRLVGPTLVLLVAPLLTAPPARAAGTVVNGRIAFTGSGGIGVVNPDGVNPHPVATAAGGENPSWSPDGQRIAYQTDAGGDFDIMSVAADGSGSPVPLTFGISNDIDPAYSPDGTRLAFASDRTGDNELFVKTLGGSLLQLTHVPDASDTQPTWSPDGTRIAFTSQGRLYAMDAHGGRQHELVPDQVLRSDPAWQPLPCTITGTPGDDALAGTGAADVICGLSGDDTFSGLGPNDLVVGGPG